MRLVQSDFGNIMSNRNRWTTFFTILMTLFLLGMGFVGFVEALEDVGQKIGKAHESYKLAHNRLSEGKGNLVRRTEELRQLGVKTQKSLPENLAVQALEGE